MNKILKPKAHMYTYADIFYELLTIIIIVI